MRACMCEESGLLKQSKAKQSRHQRPNRGIARMLIHRLLREQVRDRRKPVHVGFVKNKVPLRIFFRELPFTLQSSLHPCFLFIPLSLAGTLGAAVPPGILSH